MIKQISKKIYNFMSRYFKVEPELKNIYIYGIEITVSTALNVCLVMLAAVLLKSPLSGVCHLGCIIILRSFCGGYHADSYFKCNCLMVIFFVISYFGGKLLVYFNLTNFKLLSIFLMLAFLPIYAFAPVKNKHKILSESKAKKMQNSVHYNLYYFKPIWLVFILLWFLIRINNNRNFD